MILKTLILSTSVALTLFACSDSTTKPNGEDVASVSSSVSSSSSPVIPSSSSNNMSSSSVAMVSGSSIKEISSSDVVLSSSSEKVSSSSVYWNTSIRYGSLTDSRDGHAYRTVVIGTQTWMAENVAYLPSVNREDEYSISNAKHYVYDYKGTFVEEAKANPNYSTYGVLYNYLAATRACPSGWHLPDTTDWKTLVDYVDANNGTKGVGNSLKAITGWTTDPTIDNSDDFGFHALPGGAHYSQSSIEIEPYGQWWTATLYGNSEAYYFYMANFHSGVNIRSLDQYNGFSVRCLKD